MWKDGRNILSIEIIGCDSGDWTVVILNGDVYYSGHNIPISVWCNLIRNVGVTVLNKTISDDEMEEIS